MGTRIEEGNELNKMLMINNKFEAFGATLYNMTNDKKNGAITLNLAKAKVIFDKDAVAFDETELEDEWVLPDED